MTTKKRAGGEWIVEHFTQILARKKEKKKPPPPHHNQIQSLWKCNYGRQRLELSVEPSIGPLVTLSHTWWFEAVHVRVSSSLIFKAQSSVKHSRAQFVMHHKSVQSHCNVMLCVKRMLWLFPRCKHFGGKVRISCLRFFFFFLSGDQLTNMYCCLYVGMGPQWLSKLRWLWPSVR